MNRIQSLFKHKHKLFITIASLLLILTMLPTTILGASSYELLEGAYYGGGQAGSAWQGKKITGAKWPSNAATTEYRYGYRFYLVDAQGNIQFSVRDLIFFNTNNFTIKESLLETRSINGKATATVVERLEATQLTSVNSEAVVKNDVISIYNAVSDDGDVVSGNSFKQWMEYEDNKGVRNSTKVIAYLYEDEYQQMKKNDSSLKYNSVVEYLQHHPDWYLIIEPTMLINVWTNVEWAPYNTVTERKHYLLKATAGNAYIDLCCNKTQWDYKDNTDSTSYNKPGTKELIYSNDIILSMGKPDFQYQGLRNAYLDALNNEIYGYILGNELTLIDYLNTYGKGHGEYSQFAINMLLTRVKNNTGNNYPITLSSEKVYAGKANGIENAVEMFDYTSYCENAKLPNGQLANKTYLESKNPGNHAVSFNLGYVYGTWYNQMEYLRNNVPNSEGKSVKNNGGMTGGYYNILGRGFNLSESITDLGLSAPLNNVSTTTSITASIGNGIHVMNVGDTLGLPSQPIHTKNPIDPTPADPNDPITPEVPLEDNQNTGTSTIIKVYGDIYKDDYGTVHHIKDVKTYSQSQTTDWIIVEDEPTYKLQGWVVSNTAPDSNYTATKWLTDSSNKYVGIDKGFDKLWLFKSSSSGYKKTYTEADNFHIGEDNVIYLLYLKEMPYIKTSDKKVPDNSTQYEPTNPTYPENPYNPNNKDKQGAFTIIKLYALLDEYNGAPLSYEIKPQKSTTPFIKIESESNWTLAQWYTTDKTNQSVTANDFLQKASTNDQLKQFYEKGFYLKTPSTATIGNIKSKGVIATTKYFNDGSNTIYLIYTRTKEQVNYNATEQLITESYLAKRFSTSGYWNVLGHFVINDLKLTVTTSTGTIEEDFRNHLFTVVNPKLNGGSWVDRDITFKVDCLADTNGSIIPSLSAIYRASGRSASGDPLPYIGDYMRVKFDSEAALFSDLEYRFTAYRKDDSVTLANWKNNDSNLLAVDLAQFRDAANKISGIANNYFKLGNTASVRTNLNELKHTTHLVFKTASTSDLSTATSGGAATADIKSIREIQLDMGVKTQVYAGKPTTSGAVANTNKNVAGKNGNTVYSGYMTSELVTGSNEVKFIPYIKMQFDTSAISGNAVFVMGRYQRTLQVNEYAGIEFTINPSQTSIVSSNPSGKGKIKLSSDQWSTHASSTSKVGEGCALPGGATLNMSVPEANRNTVYVETIYPILVGSGKNQVTATGGSSQLQSSLTSSQNQAHQDFVNSTMAGLETLNVEQWISNKYNADDVSNSILADKKADKPVWSMSNAHKVSYVGKDGKYYFRDDDDNDTNGNDIKSGDSNTGDLDVKQGNTNTTYYTFFVNTNGEIRCKIANNLGTASTITAETDGELVLSKGQTITNLSDTRFKTINDKTGIVTNLLAALELNTGNDKNAQWASEDGHWYNEAFDGVTYVVTRTQIEVGFVNPYERGSLLDPELTPPNSGKNDLFSSYVYSQLRMQNSCMLYSGVTGKIGIYRGKDICSNYISELMTSDIFLIPNVTVQDLK